MAGKRERRIVNTALLVVAVLCICSNFTQDGHNFRNLLWKIEIERHAAMEDGKPVMHTFFHRIDPEVTTKNTGMSDEADEIMLATWRQAWEDAGWATRVLTLDDAMKHVNFHYFNSTLREFQYGRKFREYDVLCFLRWLALAMSDGGWACDYDVFPLNPVNGGAKILPNDGTFTAYEKIPRGAAVPSLVSATKEEYNRISHDLVKNAATHQGKEEFWTDFFSLIDLHIQDSDSYFIEDAVIPGKYVLTGQHFTLEDCEKLTSGKMGVHFAHDAISNGVTREGETVHDRAKIGLSFLQMWKERCNNDEPFTPAALIPSEPVTITASELADTATTEIPDKASFQEANKASSEVVEPETNVVYSAPQRQER